MSSLPLPRTLAAKKSPLLPPQDREIQATRARVYEACMERETARIGKAIFAGRQSDARDAVRNVNSRVVAEL
jgi:hypothetical protein